MMKNYVLASMAALTFILGACGNESETKKEETTNTTETATEETPESTVAFENGVLETDTFKLSIKDAEVIKSPAEDSDGLFITYELENKGDSDIVPKETLNYLVVTQENDTSKVTLENNYYFLDAYGDDPETYNKMVDIDNATANALLPGKTVEFQNAIYLDNHDKPVVMTATDETGIEVGTYEITVK